MFDWPQHNAHVALHRSAMLGLEKAAETARFLDEKFGPQFALAESMKREWPEAFGLKRKVQPPRLVVDNDRPLPPAAA